MLGPGSSQESAADLTKELRSAPAGKHLCCASCSDSNTTIDIVAVHARKQQKRSVFSLVLRDPNRHNLIAVQAKLLQRRSMISLRSSSTKLECPLSPSISTGSGKRATSTQLEATFPTTSHRSKMHGWRALTVGLHACTSFHLASSLLKASSITGCHCFACHDIMCLHELGC